MRELKFVAHASSARGRAGWPLSRNAFVASVLVHAAAAYVMSRMVLSVDLPQLPQILHAEILSIGERAVSQPMEQPDVAVPQPPPIVEMRASPAPSAAPQPEVIAPEPAPPAQTVVERSEPVAAPPPPPLVAPSIDFDEARRRAAAEVVGERSAENEYLTFSIDDVAPPRAEPEPKPKRSIFDGDGADFGGRSVGTVGQQRTRIGRKLAEFCNALTGGFGVFGFFSACASPDDEPSGLFPEVRPAYLDLVPECAESQPENPELAAAAQFSTVKCRLVRQVDVERWAYPGKPATAPSGLP